MSIADSTRRELAVLARRPQSREAKFSSTRPTEWHPQQVRNPAGGLGAPFTDSGAWDLIASKIESGHDIEVVELRKPVGATGYVMKIELEPTAPVLYVKLELRSGRILGRSFHYSKHE